MKRKFVGAICESSTFVGKSLSCELGAGAVVGTVMCIHSAARLSQKMTADNKTEDNAFNFTLLKAITTTALGVMFSALIHTAGHYFWDIAPSFCWPQRVSTKSFGGKI